MVKLLGFRVWVQDLGFREPKYIPDYTIAVSIFFSLIPISPNTTQYEGLFRFFA